MKKRASTRVPGELAYGQEIPEPKRRYKESEPCPVVDLLGLESLAYFAGGGITPLPLNSTKEWFWRKLTVGNFMKAFYSRGN